MGGRFCVFYKNSHMFYKLMENKNIVKNYLYFLIVKKKKNIDQM